MFIQLLIPISKIFNRVPPANITINKSYFLKGWDCSLLRDLLEFYGNVWSYNV